MVMVMTDVVERVAMGLALVEVERAASFPAAAACAP
jgi:hypothetical protein